MEIKLAKIEDVDKIIELGNSVDEFQVSHEVVTFWPKNILIDCINSKSNPILVAKDNDKIIGFIIANYNSSFKKAIIENIFVKTDFQGKSVGKMLLNALLDELIKLKCEYVCLLVESSNNKSFEFFSKNNFNKGIDCIWLDRIIGDSFNKK